MGSWLLRAETHTVFFIMLIMLSIISPVHLYAGNIEFTVSPSDVELAPGESCIVTIEYSTDIPIHVEFNKVIIAKTPSGSDAGTILYVSGLESPFTINGSGTFEFTVVTSSLFMGTYEIVFRSQDTGDVLDTLTVRLTKPPKGSISVNTTSIVLKEMKWFKYHDPFKGWKNFTVLGENRVRVEIKDLNKASIGAKIRVDSTLPIYTNIPRSISSIENQAYNATIKLSEYVEPGEYDLEITVSKLFYQTGAMDNDGTYPIIGNVTYNVSSAKINIIVKNVPPPSEFAGVKEAYIVSADAEFSSKDNVFLDMYMDMKTYVDLWEYVFDPEIDFPHYIMIVLIASTLYGDREVLSISASANTRYPFKVKVNDCGWENLRQTRGRQKQFPYLKYMNTTGYVHAWNYTSSLPLTPDSLFLLAHSKGIMFKIRILYWNENEPMKSQVLKEIKEVYPWQYIPPFYSVMESNLTVHNVNYTININQISGKYKIIVDTDMLMDLLIKHVIGDSRFTRIYNDYGMNDGSSDTAILVIETTIVGEENISRREYYPLEYLSSGKYSLRYYPRIVENLSTDIVDQINFTTRYDPAKNDYVPVLEDVALTKGNVMFEKFRVESDISYEKLLKMEKLIIRVMIIDRFMNETINIYEEEHDIRSIIKNALKNVNKPPKGVIEVSNKFLGVGDVLHVKSITSDIDGKVVMTKWIIYDSNNTKIFEKLGEELDYRFEEPGYYTVMLIVRDDDGATTNVSTGVQVLGNIELYVEKDVTIGSVPEAVLANTAGGTWSITVLHVGTNREVSINPSNPLRIIDLLTPFTQSPNSIMSGEYIVRIDVRGPYSDRFKTDYMAPPIMLRLSVDVDKQVSIQLIETWNTWTIKDDGSWGVIIRGVDSKDITYGVKLRFRLYETWETIYIEFLKKFLQEAGFTNKEINEILSVKIEYVKNTNPRYDPSAETIYLPAKEMFYLSHVPGTLSGGWILGKTANIRVDDNMDSFYHEFGHRIKHCLYTPKDFRDLVLEYLGTSGKHTVYEPFPAILGIKTLSSIGAFDEAHSELFATLILEYIRGTIYYNTTLPVLPRPYFYDEYYEKNILVKPGILHGTKYDGYLVEGRVAGALLYMLYEPPPSSRGINYASDPEKAVNAYNMFRNAVIYSNKLIKRPPMTGREIIYFLLMKYPELYGKALFVNDPDQYNLKLSINSFRDIKVNGTVVGSNLLVYVYESEIITAYRKNGALKTYTLDSNDVIMFKPTEKSYIESFLVGEPSGIYNPARIIIDLRDNGGNEIFNAVVDLLSYHSRIEFLKDSIRLYGDIRVYVYYARGIGRNFEIVGSSVIVIPHSTIVFIQSEKNTTIYVLEGEITVKTEKSIKTVAENNYVLINEKGEIREEKFDPTTLNKWWSISSEEVISKLNTDVYGNQTTNILENPYSVVISKITILPSTSIKQGDTITIIIEYNTGINISMHDVELRILDENNNVIIKEKLEPFDHKSVYTYKIQLFEHGKRTIQIYIDDNLVYSKDIDIEYNIGIIMGIIFLILIMTAAVIKLRHRRKH